MHRSDRQKEIDFVDLYQQILSARVITGDVWYYAGHSFHRAVQDTHAPELCRELGRTGVYSTYWSIRESLQDEIEAMLLARSSMYNRARKCDKILKVLCSKQ